MLPSLEEAYRRSPQFGFRAWPPRAATGATAVHVCKFRRFHAAIGVLQLQLNQPLCCHPGELCEAEHGTNSSCAGPLPGAGPVTLHAAALADPPVSDAKAAATCRWALASRTCCFMYM